MRKLVALALFLVSFPTLSNHDLCSSVYYSGWYCDGGYAVHCSYDYYYDEFYEDDYQNCGSLPNSNGYCFGGSCSCSLFSCVRGFQNRDCSCSCSPNWSGLRCDFCTRSDAECAPNGYMNRQTCSCTCANGCLNGGTQSGSCACSCPSPWTGTRCDICTRSSAECSNGGYMDTKTCQCVCPNKCANGGTQDANCNCACPDPWVGPRCQSCGLNQGNCENGSTLDSNKCQCDCVKGCNNGGTHTRTCGCDCPYPWSAKFCDTCSIGSGHCKNNGNFTAGACACDCTDAKTCAHAGRRMTDFSCGCDCVGGWTGDDCEKCGRDSAFCQRGGAFQLNTCDCNCQGSACTNGKLNERCQCLCSAGYKGEDCSIASAAFAVAPSVVGLVAILFGVVQFMGN